MDDRKIKVLYLVSENVATSIPLEIAEKVISPRVQLIKIAYNKRSNKPISTSKNLIEMDSTGYFDYKSINKLYYYIKSVNPDVIHIHHSYSGLISSIIAFFLDIPVIKTEHSAHNRHGIIKRFFNIINYIFIDRVLCNSKFTYNSFSFFENLVIEEKKSVVYNGIDFQKINSCISISNPEVPLYKESKSDKIIVSVGRLIPIKNYKKLLKGLALISEEFKNYHLYIVGGGRKEKELKKLSRSLDINKNVSFVGFVKRKFVYKYLHLADIFTISSLSEGFCNAVVEAMATATPVICSDIPTLKEVVGRNGIYFDPTSTESISNNLLKMLQNSSEELKSLGEMLKSRAESKFRIENTAKEYIKWYKRTVERN